MKRWFGVILFGTLLGIVVSLVDLPFHGSLFRLIMQIRGPLPANPNVLVLTFDHVEQDWLTSSCRLLRYLSQDPPIAVSFDFSLDDRELTQLEADQQSYQVFWRQPWGMQSPTEPALPLVSSPEYVNPSGQQSTPDPFLYYTADLNLLRAAAPLQLLRFMAAEPRIVNFVGPPGSFRHLSVDDVLEHPEQVGGWGDKIVLISPPTEKQRPRATAFAFYKKGFAEGSDRTEIQANVIDTILRERGIRLLPKWVSPTLTILVSVLTTAAFVASSPVLGVVSMVLITFALFVSSLLFLKSFSYLDLLQPLSAIAFSYYFLIPYRLIVEYKGRWRYQEENKLLSEVETLKDNFMSLVSHNLKTPIARIQGVVETLLQKEGADPLTVRESLQRVLQSVEDLNNFVSRILHLARVEHPEYQLHLITKDPNSLVELVVARYHPMAAEKGISIRTNLEPLFPSQLDADLIQESIANLVENAVKYSPPGGAVEISTREEDDWIHIEVADSGAGIPLEDHEKIFTKFYRGAEVKNKGIRGSGLGLYLVKYFVELHGGRVSLKRRDGGGSLFSIQLLRK